MFILYADKANLTLRQREPLTSGAVNVYSVCFEFSEDWEGLTRTAVFRAGERSVSVPLDESGVCSVPWEVLVNSGRRLEAGAYGAKGTEIVLPTVWTSLGYIRKGAVPSGEEGTPAPPAAGGVYEFGHGFKMEGNRISIDTVENFQGDNTLPMTAAGVEAVVGNIEVLLGTI